MGTCHVVIESEPHSGVHNMAVDEALLEAAIKRGACTVRWYRWERATISLGYFQDASLAAADPHLAGLPTVRRLSGGGAILHHYEWTYSVALPASHPLAKTPGKIYELVHERIIAGLAEHGIEAALRGEALAHREGTFLCFGRGDARDVILKGHKIVGSAQRRRRGAVLQHGSLLVSRSEFAPQFPGLMDLVNGNRVDNEEFVRGLGETIGVALGQAALAISHQRIVEDRAEKLQSRYRNIDRPISLRQGSR